MGILSVVAGNFLVVGAAGLILGFGVVPFVVVVLIVVTTVVILFGFLVVVSDTFGWLGLAK